MLNSDQLVAVSPFWGEVDLLGGTSQDDVFYKVYKDSEAADRAMLDRIQNYVRQQPVNGTSYPSYSTKLSLVVTWYQVVPFSQDKSLVLDEVRFFS